MSNELTLLDAIDDMILVGAVAKDWKEAVKLAGKLLVEGKRVKETYVDAMIKTTEELGPYAVIAPGVAIPHARPEDGVIKPGFSIVVLKESVKFNSPNDPVYIVIGFAATDKKSHLKALQILAKLLSNNEFLDNLKRCRTKENVKKLIRLFLAGIVQD
ncbi:MAG: PTS sugar transporter subunit IIA [Staphylothermus sp.]|nr:PTS sugar transporter subunit IIA [Staphylothermus sp.]